MGDTKKGTVSIDLYKFKVGNHMKLKRIIGIVLISIILSSVNAIAVLANGNKNTDTTMYDSTKYDSTKYDSTKYDSTKYDSTKYDSTKYDSTKYDSTKYDSTTLKSNPELVVPNLIAAFTATRDPDNPLTVSFTETSIGKPVPYFWGTKYGIMTYFWGFGDKTTSILKNPIHSFKEAGEYKVYLRIQNAEGQVSKAVMVINV
jgi:PKD repeat protein